MTHPPRPPSEVRPTGPVGGPPDVTPPVPLLRLRRHGREPIPPERCLLGPDCLVCRWRREGLLDRPPDDRAA